MTKDKLSSKIAALFAFARRGTCGRTAALALPTAPKEKRTPCCALCLLRSHAFSLGLGNDQLAHTFQRPRETSCEDCFVSSLGEGIVVGAPAPPGQRRSSAQPAAAGRRSTCTCARCGNPIPEKVRTQSRRQGCRSIFGSIEAPRRCMETGTKHSELRHKGYKTLVHGRTTIILAHLDRLLFGVCKSVQAPSCAQLGSRWETGADPARHMRGAATASAGAAKSTCSGGSQRWRPTVLDGTVESSAWYSPRTSRSSMFRPARGARILHPPASH